MFKTCHTCQLTNRTSIKHGKLPLKEHNGKPLDTLCVDLIYPDTIHSKGKFNNGHKLHALTL